MGLHNPLHVLSYGSKMFIKLDVSIRIRALYGKGKEIVKEITEVLLDYGLTLQKFKQSKLRGH